MPDFDEVLLVPAQPYLRCWFIVAHSPLHSRLSFRNYIPCSCPSGQHAWLGSPAPNTDRCPTSLPPAALPQLRSGNLATVESLPRRPSPRREGLLLRGGVSKPAGADRRRSRASLPPLTPGGVVVKTRRLSNGRKAVGKLSAGVVEERRGPEGCGGGIRSRGRLPKVRVVLG